MLQVDPLGLAEGARVPLVEGLGERVVDVLGMGVRGHPGRFAEAMLEGDEVLIHPVGGQDRLGHLGLGQLLAEPLDHDHGLVGARHDQVEVAGLHLLGRGERDELALDPAEPDGPDRAEERDVGGQDERSRGAEDRQDVRVIHAVGGDRPGLDLDFVAIVGREQGANRPVDQARGEDFLGRGAAFSLDESAGELAGGIDLFPVVHRQREEVEPFAARRGDGGHQAHGIAQPDDDGAVSLLGEPAGFQAEGLAVERDLNGDGFAGSRRGSRHLTYLGGSAGWVPRWVAPGGLEGRGRARTRGEGVREKAEPTGWDRIASVGGELPRSGRTGDGRTFRVTCGCRAAQ